MHNANLVMAELLLTHGKQKSANNRESGLVHDLFGIGGIWEWS
jgi:hypothetical protein